MIKRLLIVLIAILPAALAAQQGTANGEWRTYAGDLGATRYAPLDQITAANFNSLKSPGGSAPRISVRVLTSTCKPRR